MILEIKYKNIGPFKEEAVFSMIPTSYGGKTENVFSDELGHNALKVGMVYGKNSAGKTNLIKPLFSLRKELLNPSLSSEAIDRMYNPHRFDLTTKEEPCELSLTFVLNGVKYRYEIGYSAQKYTKEVLFAFKNNQQEPLFTRIPKEYGPHDVDFHKENILGALICPIVEKNNLVLSQFLRCPNDEIGEICRYLAGLQIGNGYNDHMRDNLWKEVKDWIKQNRTINGQRLTNLLKSLDIDLNSFTLPQMSEEPFSKVKFIHSLYDNGNETDKTEALKIIDESQGSRWLFIIGAKVIESLDRGCPLFLDELDACFHIQVTEFLIDLFRDPRINKKNSQLIITTHNVHLMNESKMRRDQIWIVDKNEKGCSELYSLSEFEDIDEDTDFTGWYLASRFGGTPNLKPVFGIFE